MYTVHTELYLISALKVHTAIIYWQFNFVCVYHTSYGIDIRHSTFQSNALQNYPYIIHKWFESEIHSKILIELRCDVWMLYERIERLKMMRVHFGGIWKGEHAFPEKHLSLTFIYRCVMLYVCVAVVPWCIKINEIPQAMAHLSYEIRLSNQTNCCNTDNKSNIYFTRQQLHPYLTTITISSQQPCVLPE